MDQRGKTILCDDGRDLHVRYATDDGPERDGTIPALHLIRDDQGDVYISVGGEKQCWTVVRLCASGGVLNRCVGLYVGVSIALYSLAGKDERARRLAAEFAEERRR